MSQKERKFTEHDLETLNVIVEEIEAARSAIAGNETLTHDNQFFCMVIRDNKLAMLTACQTGLIAHAMAKLIFADNSILVDLIAHLMTDRETAILLPNTVETVLQAMQMVTEGASGAKDVN